MKKSLNELIQSLALQDVEVLRSIYTFRCLNENQIDQLHFKNSMPIDQQQSKAFTSRCIQELLDWELVRVVEYLGAERVYFLTPLGIEVIRHYFKMPRNIYDAKKKVVKRGYYRASELAIYPKNINHQVRLNQFVIDFQIQNSELNWKYFDEKYVSQYTNIRPDGMLSILDTDFFLEMDMATESKKQLYEKWENYRNFLSSREYAYREKRIVVLFIVDGTTKIKERIDLIKYTIYERLLDVLDTDFEVYVGTSDSLLTLMKNKLIPACKNSDPCTAQVKKYLQEQHDFHVSDGDSLNAVLKGTKYALYIRKLNENNKLLVEGGRIQEFVVDDYFYEPTTIVSKVAYLDKYNSFFKSIYKRDISYLIVGESEEKIYNDLKLVDLIGLKNIYFTTLQRLKEKTFHQAVFQFDLLGNIHHFTNSGLEERVFESNLE
ncbi:replication-relaxation family protein (plasmid) [Paenibacillus thiaminolyticus]|uniref:replication-relaxation family protein n=1 Tax=Paenibacillus thiaminolyticus TaxID=49283 RepID=UPI00232E5744|nr:replication-relaxation family protein [Paenibacillus thiaminolyticus]WCF11742.1 replication-relaxation family protein [Paenibacillus thiaminolyticus]